MWYCPGSRGLPTEGVLMDCVWCGRMFLSEDDSHRFCSDSCVRTWEAEDGDWSGWEAGIAAWTTERAERGE